MFDTCGNNIFTGMKTLYAFSAFLWILSLSSVGMLFFAFTDDSSDVVDVSSPDLSSDYLSNNIDEGAQENAQTGLCAVGLMGDGDIDNQSTDDKPHQQNTAQETLEECVTNSK